MALYRLVCAFSQHSLVTVLTRSGWPLPMSILADEKHRHCLTDKVYLPTIVSGRVIWHLGYSVSNNAAAFTESYGVFQQPTLHHGPAALHDASLPSSHRMIGADQATTPLYNRKLERFDYTAL